MATMCLKLILLKEVRQYPKQKAPRPQFRESLMSRARDLYFWESTNGEVMFQELIILSDMESYVMSQINANQRINQFQTGYLSRCSFQLSPLLSLFIKPQMWTSLVFYLFVLLALLVLYRSALKPYQLYRYYKKQLKDKNYRSYNVAFIPFIAPSIINSLTQAKKYKDGYYSAKMIGKDYDVVLTNLASQISLVLISPKLIQEFYLLDGTPTYIKQKTFITSLKRIVKTSITFTEGEQWKAKRRFMTSFFNFNYINKEYTTVVDIVNRKLNEAAKGRDQFQIYMLQLLQQMTSATIIQLFFGGGSTNVQNLEIQGTKVSSFMRVLVEHLGAQALDPVSLVLGQEFPEKNLRAKDRLVTHEVEKFKQFTTNFVRDRIYEIKQGKSKKQDYVKKIYDSVTEEERTPQFITKVMYDFSSLYVAGTDTTSHSAMMVIYYLIMYPSVRAKLLEEIEKHIKSDEDIVYEKVKEMVYLDCVIHESLRIYQPANGIFIREATKDHLLGDLKILKGTMIMISSLSNHYNPEHFENPTQFRPERWLSQEGTLKSPKPFTWLTFSAGARSCIGKQLALTELRIIVIQFLRKYEMTMQSTDLTMKVQNFSYQPQKMMTRFVKK